ncbi:TIR domain-containing protein [Microbulbifer sp. TRSA005]|uniref:TIR domain-containing protein n=1 Tax=Microbulbifer sp. TRSA005 TaxID=3243383 RepID=UPI00403933DD
MDKEIVISQLEALQSRMENDVAQAYVEGDVHYGNERLTSWSRVIVQFLDEHLPGESKFLAPKLGKRLGTYTTKSEYYTLADLFWMDIGNAITAYLDSLILDLKNGDYISKQVDHAPKSAVIKEKKAEKEKPKNKIFIVHGHDGSVKQRTARFLERLGFTPIILSDEASQGMTIIEKIESHSDEVGFAIVLYTPDDVGNVRSDGEAGKLNARARQNVVFEHGYLIGKLGRRNVIPLVEGQLELPNDISGVVYINKENWQVDIAREMKAAGYNVDFNKII